MENVQMFNESLSSLSETISELGVLVVIAAVFIIVAVSIVALITTQTKRQSKHIEDSEKSSMERMMEENREYMKQMLEQNTQLVTAILESKAKSEQRDSPENIMVKDRVVEQTLADGRQRCDAERADIFLFTNGTHSFNQKKSFLKFMRAYSSKKAGSEIEPLKEAPTSLFPSLFDKLMKDKIICVNESKEFVSEDVMVPGWLSDSAGAHIIGLIKEKDDPIGFVTCSYAKPENTEKHHKEFHDLAVKLSVLLQYETQE